MIEGWAEFKLAWWRPEGCSQRILGLQQRHEQRHSLETITSTEFFAELHVHCSRRTTGIDLVGNDSWDVQPDHRSDRLQSALLLLLRLFEHRVHCTCTYV